MALASSAAFACGSDGTSGADVSSSIAFRARHATTCMLGTDVDGDGITDRFDVMRTHFKALPPDACYAAGGTVMEHWRGPSPLRTTQVVAPVTQNFPAGGEAPNEVLDVVDDTNVHGRRTYQQPYSDCDDYANELETAFEGEGYNGTYTEICKIGEPNTYHAITDIHLDGRTYWIDANSGKQVNLDVNGDGQVTAATTGEACAAATEGGWGVRVWNNLGERVAELGSPDF